MRSHELINMSREQRSRSGPPRRRGRRSRHDKTRMGGMPASVRARFPMRRFRSSFAWENNRLFTSYHRIRDPTEDGLRRTRAAQLPVPTV